MCDVAHTLPGAPAPPFPPPPYASPPYYPGQSWCLQQGVVHSTPVFKLAALEGAPGTSNFKQPFSLTLTSSPFPPYAREIGKAMKPRSSLGLALFIASAPWNNGGSRQAVSGFHQPAAFRNFQQKSQSSILLPTPTRYALELNKGRAWGRAGRCWPDGVFTWCRLSSQTLSAIIFSALAQRRASFSSRGRKISLQQRRSLIRFYRIFSKHTYPAPCAGPS